MGKYDAMRKLLHDAYMLKAIEDLAEIPSDEEIDKIHQFSPEFKQRMADMMNECFGCRNKTELAIARKRHIETVKKFATAAAVSMAFTFSCAMSVEAIRESFVKFVVRIYDDYLKISLPKKDGVDSPSLETIATYYEPTWIPEGCGEKKRIKTTDEFFVQYQQGDKVTIFAQKLLTTSDTLIDFDKKNGNVEEIENYGTYVYANNAHQLVWTDESYCYYISCSSSKEDLLKMAKSVQPNNTIPVSVDVQDEIKEYYIPKWVPDGFTLCESEKMPGYNFRRYVNGNKEFTFLQCKSVEYMATRLADYELSNYALELIEGVGRFQYAPSRPSLLSFQRDNYFYLITGNLPKEDFAQLATSIKPELQ